MELEQLLQLAVKYKALKVSDGTLSVEMAPFAPQWAAQSATEPPAMISDEVPCKCGHHASVQHNEAGLCLEGCDPEVCHPREGT